MTGWKHGDVDYDGIVIAGDLLTGECVRCGWVDHNPRVCRTPTPDPASPCAFEGCASQILDGALGHRPFEYVHRCPDPERHVETPKCHPHVPTRCTCGHALVPA